MTQIRLRKLSMLLLLAILLAGVFGGVSSAQAAEHDQQSQFVTPVLVANTSFLNIRSGPGVQFNIIITVVGGTELPVLAIASDRVWYQVSTVAGVGWVNVEFTVPRGDFSRVPVVSPPTAAEIISSGQGTTVGTTPSAGVGPTAQAGGGSVGVSRVSISVDAVSLRTQPSESSATIGTVFRDDTQLYVVVGSTVDGNGIEWYQIVVPDVGTGWVDSGKVIFRPSEDGGRTVVVVVGDAVAMTNAPGGGNDGTLPILSRGQEAYLVGVSRDANFVEIELFGGGVRGWVPVSSVQERPRLIAEEDEVTTVAPGTGQPGVGATPGAPVGPSLSVPRVVINTGFLNIRSGPGSQFSVVATVPGGTELPVLGIAPDRVWYLVQGSFGRGWLNVEFALVRGDMSTVPIIRDTTGVGELANPIAVVSGSVTLYAAPATNFGTIGVLTGPIEVDVVARTADNSWLQLNTPLGFGWVPGDQVPVRGDLGLVPIVG